MIFDVLHHIEFPRTFFAEAQPGACPWRTDGDGRAGDHTDKLVLLPLRSPGACQPLCRSVGGRESESDKDPYAANQAIPTLLVRRYAQRLTLLFPDLRVRHVRWLSLFAYPLAGGFKPWSLIPLPLVGPVLRLEDAISGTMGRLLGFRVLITIEKCSVDKRPASDGC